MKHKNVEVGQHVIKRSTSPYWPMAADHIGEEFTVVEVKPLDYFGGDTEGCATVLVRSVKEGSLRAEFWCNHRHLKLVKEKPEAPKQELPWPWPKGTPVALTTEGRVQCGASLRRNYLPLDTPLFLGSDGSDIPPLETADGWYICYVDDTYVERK